MRHSHVQTKKNTHTHWDPTLSASGDISNDFSKLYGLDYFQHFEWIAARTVEQSHWLMWPINLHFFSYLCVSQTGSAHPPKRTQTQQGCVCVCASVCADWIEISCLLLDWDWIVIAQQMKFNAMFFFRSLGNST